MKNPTLEFIIESFFHIKEIGTIFPCSGATGRKMAKHIDPYKSGTIVELGSGTGPVSEQIVNRMNGRHKFFGFEKNRNFYEILRERFNGDGRVKIINDLAENMTRYVGRNVQCVISVLPLANMKASEKKFLLETIRYSLASGGRFVQFQYLPVDRNLVNKYFDIDYIEMSWMNLPPGVIYTGVKRELQK